VSSKSLDGRSPKDLITPYEAGFCKGEHQHEGNDSGFMSWSEWKDPIAVLTFESTNCRESPLSTGSLNVLQIDQPDNFKEKLISHGAIGDADIRKSD
jgi:hypothetical protein